MTNLDWEKAKEKYKDKSRDFKVKKQIVKRRRKPANLCKMKGCKQKRYTNSNKFKQSYCLFHCMQFNKVL